MENPLGKALENIHWNKSVMVSLAENEKLLTIHLNAYITSEITLLSQTLYKCIPELSFFLTHWIVQL